MKIRLFHEPGPSHPAVILFHGITGTPDELSPLAEQLFESGFDVLVPLLSGHGTSIAELKTIPAGRWIEDIQESLKEIEARKPTKLFAVGLSFGALLSLYLACKEHAALSGLVLLSTPYVLRSTFRERALRILSFFPDIILNQLGIVPKPVRDNGLFLRPRQGYPYHSIGGLARAKYLQRLVSKQILAVRCPTLLMQDPEDHLVSPTSLATLQDLLKSTDVHTHWVRGGMHELTIGPHATQVNTQITTFLSELARGRH